MVLLAASLRAVPPAPSTLHMLHMPQMPQRLSETGLYLPGTLAVDPRNRPYSPQYPLWTDGAAKARWIRLPDDRRIDARYLTANCGHCHNEHSPVATVRFPLRATGFASRAQTNDLVARLLTRVTDWDLPGREPGSSPMITPGAPDLSVLLVRMRSRRPSTQMPPLGTVVPDRDAIELISSWISEMSEGPLGPGEI